MKIKLFVFLAFHTLLSSLVVAQSVVITPKKTIYTRKFLKPGEPKRNFSIVYPVVGGKLNAGAKSKLVKTIRYWNAFNSSLEQNLREESWLTEASYKVNYNKNGILDIELTLAGSGAYPDSDTENLVIDLTTGEQRNFGDVFKEDSRAELAKLVNIKLQADVNALVKRIDSGEFAEKGEQSDASKVFRDQIKTLKFTADNFDEFSVSDEGVTILYDADFPHVIKAIEPAGRYFFKWAQLKPFVRRDGLFAKFVR